MAPCSRFSWIANSSDLRIVSEFFKVFLSFKISKLRAFYISHDFHHSIQYELLFEYCKRLLGYHQLNCKYIVKIHSRIKHSYLFTNPCLSLARLILIQLLLMLRPCQKSVEINFYQRCFNVVRTSDTDVLSTLGSVENPTSDFVSTLIHNVEITLIRR